MVESLDRCVITALSAKDRIDASEEFLRKIAGQEILIIAPTRMVADEFARSCCVKAGGLFGIHRFSPGALAVEIASARLAASGKSVLSGVAVDALAARAVQECRGTESLPWFEPVASTPGFF